MRYDLRPARIAAALSRVLGRLRTGLLMWRARRKARASAKAFAAYRWGVPA